MLCIEEALNHARRYNIHYDYFALLSGQDYPIKPIKWIENKLSEAYPMPFIESYSKSESGEYASVSKYNRCRWLIRYRDWTLRRFQGKVRMLFQGIGVLLRKLVKLLGMTTEQKLKKQGISVYMGSAWWILPDKIVIPVFEAYKRKNSLTEVLIAESCTPEETFFQTICRTNQFNYLFESIAGKDGLRNCMTYTDFGRKSGRSPVCHPYILTLKDIDRLRRSHCWFARKFDISIDSEVIEKIDTELLRDTEST